MLRVRHGWAAAYVALAVVILAISFAPWFRLEFTADGFRQSVDAWHGSTLWTFAVVCVVLGALLGAFALIRRVRVAAVAGLLCALVAVALWVRQWWLIEAPPPVRSGIDVFLVPSSDFAIARDHLDGYALFNGPDQHAGQTFISYAAVVLILMLVVGLVVSIFSRRARA